MKSKLAKVSSIATTAVAGFSGLLVTKVFAGPLDWLGGINEGQGGDDLGGFITKIINWGIGFAAVVAVIMLIAAGFMYITANGDENKIKKATTTLTFAIVGLIVCFIAVLLVNFVLKEFLNK